MARSVEEIQLSIQQSVEAADPTIESRSGPVFNIMLQPVSNEVAKIEAEIERVGALYSLQFQEVATEAETAALATNFGIQRAPGAKATSVVFFFRFTRPVEAAQVRRGTLVGNLDGTLNYIVQEDVVIDPANADSFFNAARRTFEVAVNVEAVSPGQNFNIPAFRINSLITPNVDFDGVENRAPAEGGSEEETQDSEVERIRERFAGLNTGSVDGIRFTASNSFPEVIQDVAVIQPASDLFRRVILTPGLDVYIAGANVETVRQNFVAIGGETEIPIASPPSVPSSLVLQINGVINVDATIVKDTSAVANTVQANEIVSLASPLVPGDVVTFTYSFNRLILDVQDIYKPATGGDSLLFGTDILVYEAVEVPITVVMSIRIASSFDIPRTTDQVTNTVLALVQQNTFGVTLYPETIRETILNTVQGVTSLNIEQFRRTDTSLRDVEIIELEANEISTLDDENFQLSIR
jgi:uncharacterized phage protein gp47/JayE